MLMCASLSSEILHQLMELHKTWYLFLGSRGHYEFKYVGHLEFKQRNRAYLNLHQIMGHKGTVK